MPDAGMEKPPASSQPMYLGHAQLPFLALILVITLVAVTIDGLALQGSAMLVGLLLAVVVTLLTFVLPWRRIGTNWLALVAIADIVVVAIYSDALFAILPGVVILIVFPVLWLCYALRWPLLLLGIAGAFGVTIFPFVHSGVMPDGPAEWGSVLLLPAAASLLAVAVHVAVIHLRQQQQKVRSVTAELRRSLAEVRDRDITTRAVLDTVDAGISLYNASGTVLLTNALAIPQLSEGPHPSTTQLAEEPDVFEEDRTTRMPLGDQIVARAARGELVTRRTFWVGEGAQQRAVVATSQYVRRASGELIGTVVATHDVTQLAEAIRSRDDFLATISHELKTPLTSILGYLDILEDRPDLADAGLARELNAIQRNSLRLHKLISALITTAKKNVSVDRRPYDVAKLVDNAVNAAQSEADKASVTLLAQAEPGAIAEIDADHINSVLDALLANGIMFTPTGGRVTISAESADDEIVVRVVDTGIGISAEDLPRVFDRFFRAATSRNNDVPGSGLGLTAAKVIVDAHHGTITLASVPGQGTTVEVRLPVLSADVGEPASDLASA